MSQKSCLACSRSRQIPNMKPYNTRKPQRGRFNAFPPSVPWWGHHHNRRVTTLHRPSTSLNGHGHDHWFLAKNNSKLHDGWWLGRDMSHYSSFYNFNHTCCLLPINIFLLFIATLGTCLVASINIVEIIAIFFTYAFLQGCCLINQQMRCLKLVAWQGCILVTNWLLLSASWLFALPPPDYFHRMYPSPLHKMMCILWYGQIMWVRSKATNVYSVVIQAGELEEKMDCKTEVVMKECITTLTGSGYDVRNITFMV